MKIQFHRNFIKQYKKQRIIQKQIEERLALFKINPFSRILNNHGLIGKYKGCRSINITGNFRAVFEILDEKTVRFVDVDTHNNLYK